MTEKAEFDAEEWDAIVQGPPSAGLLVAMADKGGSIRESLSMAKAYAEARREGGDSPLLDEIVASPPAIRPPEDATAASAHAHALDTLHAAVTTLAAKATNEEIAAYRAFVLEIAERVAAAKKEGGFLGIGGTRVSDEERAAIEEVRRVIEAEPADV